MSTRARSTFWSQLVLFNTVMLALATGCEARTRDSSRPRPSAEASAVRQKQDAAPPQKGPLPAVPLNEKGTGGSGQLQSVADLVEAVKGTVVNVDVQARTPAAEEGGGELFHHFFGMPGGSGGSGMQSRERIQQGEGSGFIIDAAGLILTNNHVVENAFSIRVRLNDGREYDARVLGRDPLTDLALLKLQGDVKALPYARLGNSDDVRVGDPVVAIGNPFGLTSSVSSGILSARARDIQAGPYDNFLQTDAAINPGNSGGPLFNAQGQVIGINTAIVGGGTGIGFAVPSNTARTLLSQLQKGKIRRGWLGVSVQDLTADLAEALHVPGPKGAIVTGVQDNTPSSRAGLKQDDVITAVNGLPVESSHSLTRDIGFRAPEETVKLTLYREGRERELQVRLAERPDLEGFTAQTTGEREQTPGRRLGLKLQDVDPRVVPNARQGAMVVEVEPGSPSDRAGLQPGMVILEAGGRTVSGPSDFVQVLHSQKAGTMLLLRIQVGDSHLLRALPVLQGS